MEHMQEHRLETVDFSDKRHLRTGSPGCLGDVHNIESELVQRNREIAQVRDKLGQREVETTTWKSRHGDLVGKLTDLEADRAKLRVQVRELCNHLESSLQQQRALLARAEKAEAGLLKQGAEAKAQLEAERTSASKHAADLAAQLANERSARLAADARVESLCVQQQTQQQQQRRQQRSPQCRPKQRRESLSELRGELVSASPEKNECQEQRVATAERETTACKDLVELAANVVRTGDGQGAVANVDGGGAIAAAAAVPQRHDNPELRVQLRLLQVEVKTLRSRLSEGLAMAAEDALVCRNQGREIATGALAREALMAAQLEETRRARSVELKALVKRMSKKEVSTVNVGTSMRVRPSVTPLPLVHGSSTGGA